MSGIFASALSGMERAAQGVQAVASNVANVDTPGYRSVRANAATGDVEYRYNPPPAQSEDDVEQASDVELTTELVELKRHEQAYRANTAVVEFENRRLGTVLDLFA